MKSEELLVRRDIGIKKITMRDFDDFLLTEIWGCSEAEGVILGVTDFSDSVK